MAKLYTVREEARRPDCPFTEYRLRRMIAAGTCPGVRIGNRFLVNHQVLVSLANADSVSHLNRDAKVVGMHE